MGPGLLLQPEAAIRLRTSCAVLGSANTVECIFSIARGSALPSLSSTGRRDTLWDAGPHADERLVHSGTMSLRFDDRR